MSDNPDGAPRPTWPDYIGWGRTINQERMEADWTGLWDYAPPHVPASEETLVRTENRLGFRLPESYRDFLLAYYLEMMEFNKLNTADIREKDGPKPEGTPHAVLDAPRGG